jgi:hypothetical protein
MKSLIIRVGALFILMIFTYHTNAQYSQNTRSLDPVFQKGVHALHQGDTLAAFQYIQTAYHLKPKQEDINYYYTYLSLVLQKPAAENDRGIGDRTPGPHAWYSRGDSFCGLILNWASSIFS